MKKILTLVIAAITAVGCVYEFTPDIVPGDATGLVVEGDIIIGDISRFTLGSIEPLSGAEVAPVRGWVWVEDDAGGEYYPESSDPSNSFEIDMTKASSDKSYRLRIRLATPVSGGSTFYSSEWKEVQKAPSIDDLSYTWEENDIESDPYTHLWLSLSSPGGSGCFRWDYEEIWEFHAEFMALYYFDPVANRAKSYNGQVPPLYNCWSYDNSHQVGLAIAKSTGGERISGYKILDIDRRDLRMQTLYYIKLKARNISEECYEYLHSIEVNSTSTGSLTQPDPSQIIGNIFSDEDPLEVVYGYIEVSKVAEKGIYISSLYIPPPEPVGDDVPPPYITDLGVMTPLEAWENGLRLRDAPGHWVDKTCVECTALGGTKIKPSFWPTSSE
jgi:hypothetical protein